MDNTVSFRHDPDSRTAFRVVDDERGHPQGEVVFGCDIFPGTSMADTNSMLSMEAAVAHELTHHYRWKNLLAINEPDLEELDEAFTSLQAISLYSAKLNDNDRQQLASDALQRLRLHLDKLRAQTGPTTEVSEA